MPSCALVSAPVEVGTPAAGAGEAEGAVVNGGTRGVNSEIGTVGTDSEDRPPPCRGVVQRLGDPLGDGESACDGSVVGSGETATMLESVSCSCERLQHDRVYGVGRLSGYNKAIPQNQYRSQKYGHRYMRSGY